LGHYGIPQMNEKKILALRSDIKTKLEQAISTVRKMEYVKPEIENELTSYVKQFRSLLQITRHRFEVHKAQNDPSKETNEETLPLLSKMKEKNDNEERFSNLSSMKELRRQNKMEQNLKGDINEEDNDEDEEEEEDSLVENEELKSKLSKLKLKSKDKDKENEEEKEMKWTSERNPMDEIADELSEMKEMFTKMDCLVESEPPEVESLPNAILINMRNETKFAKKMKKMISFSSSNGSNSLDHWQCSRNRNRWIVILLFLILAAFLAAFIWNANGYPRGRN